MKYFIRLTVGFLLMSLSLSALFSSQASAQSSNTNMYGAAENASSGFNKTAALDAGATAAFGGICKSSGWTGAGSWACPMAITSGVQFARDLINAKNSLNTANALCVNGQCPQFGGVPDTDPNSPNAGPNSLGNNTDGGGGPGTPLSPAARASLAKLGALERQVNAVTQDLSDKGYTIDPATGTVNTPKGPISADSLSSASGMAAAGFTKDEIDKAQAVIRQVASGYKNIDIGYGSGGGGGAKHVAATEKGFNVGSYMRGMMGAGRKPASADFNGLKKYVGSEPIGLAGDNIFDMVSRRYKSQAGQGAFLP